MRAQRKLRSFWRPAGYAALALLALGLVFFAGAWWQYRNNQQCVCICVTKVT